MGGRCVLFVSHFFKDVIDPKPWRYRAEWYPQLALISTLLVWFATVRAKAVLKAWRARSQGQQRPQVSWRG